MTLEGSRLDENAMVAERVRQQLAVFPTKFRELGESGELRRVLSTPHTLSGPWINQEPEQFTEQYLIEPVLHGLEYLDPTSEDYRGTGPHFVRRPSTFRNVEPKRPDYLLANVAPELVCILEAKAANNERPSGAKRDATADVEEYLASNTFAKYLASREKRYLVAIGTDGLRWVLWAKDVRTGETNEELQIVDLADVVETIARRERVIEGEPEQKTSELRQYLADEFVPHFSARSIAATVRRSFE